jgi:hypothetical protein
LLGAEQAPRLAAPRQLLASPENDSALDGGSVPAGDKA